MRLWFLFRSIWLLVTLLGVTFLTFLVLDLSPVDRAEIESMKASQSDSYVSVEHRNESIQKLRIHFGLIDPVTREPLPLWQRYSAWLGNALSLRLAGPGEDHAAFWRRLAEALPVTMLLGGMSLVISLCFGLFVGAWLGSRVGRPRERFWSTTMLAVIGIPEFLLGTLLLLTFSVVWCQWLPSGALRSSGAENWALIWQILDFAWHLILPVLVMSVGPSVMVARFVRDSVARAAGAPFVTNLQALGIESKTVRRRLLRHGAVPLATLTGGLLPMLVGGSIIVENMFSLDGLGHLAFEAVLSQDQAVVMAMVLLTTLVTLLALLISDLLHRLVDPRVRLVD